MCYLGANRTDVRELFQVLVQRELRKLLPAAERQSLLPVVTILHDKGQRALQPGALVNVAAPEVPPLTCSAIT